MIPEVEVSLDVIAVALTRLATAVENIAVEMARRNDADRDSVTPREGAYDD